MTLVVPATNRSFYRFRLSKESLALFALAMIFRLLLAAFTYGAPPIEDLQRYRQVGEHVLAGGSAYDLDLVSYPYAPPWMFVEAAAVWVSDRTGIAFDFVIKLPVIIADALIAVVLYEALRQNNVSKPVSFRWSVVYALNPLAVMVSAGHGQFDAIVLLGMLLAWVWLPRHPRWSALALGIAITLKLYPILLIPAMLLRFDREQQRTALIGWLALVCVPSIVVILPFLILNQWDALLRPIQYGLVGTTALGILALLNDLGVPIRGITPGLDSNLGGGLGQILSRGRLSILLRLILAGGMIALCARAWRNLRRIDALPLTLLLLVYLLSGLAVQYLIWVLPFGLLRRDRFALFYTVTASLLAAGLYLTKLPSALLGARAAPPIDAAVVSYLNALFYAVVVWWFARLLLARD